MAYQRKIHHRDEHCLNCGYPIVGDYCAKCGQKAHLHKDSFWHMVVHFAGDYFHYDNKFWLTLKTLVLAPGQITLDYNSGKRARYLNPIQLYIFITTVFFILFYGLIPESEDIVHIRPESKAPPYTYTFQDTTENLATADTDTSDPKEQQLADSVLANNNAYMAGKSAGTQAARLLEGALTVHDYDSIQKQLPTHAKDGWL